MLGTSNFLGPSHFEPALGNLDSTYLDLFVQAIFDGSKISNEKPSYKNIYCNVKACFGSFNNYVDKKRSVHFEMLFWCHRFDQKTNKIL